MQGFCPTLGHVYLESGCGHCLLVLGSTSSCLAFCGPFSVGCSFQSCDQRSLSTSLAVFRQTVYRRAALESGDHWSSQLWSGGPGAGLCSPHGTLPGGCRCAGTLRLSLQKAQWCPPMRFCSLGFCFCFVSVSPCVCWGVSCTRLLS